MSFLSAQDTPALGSAARLAALPVFRVFVSSTWLDLQPERKAVERALQAIREAKFVGMEYFGGRDETTREASVEEVDSSQVYIGIVGGRYGSGITDTEYKRARERGLDCFIYIKKDAAIAPQDADDDPAAQAQLTDFVQRLRAAHTVVEFSSPDNLEAQVTRDLTRWIEGHREPGWLQAMLADMLTAFGRLSRGGAALLAVAAMLGVVWWEWEHVATLPGVAQIVSWINKEPLPKANAAKFTIAVARLENDPNGEMRNLILDELRTFRGVTILGPAQAIATGGADLEQSERRGHQQARALLANMQADVLVWGAAIRLGGESRPRLYWTPASDLALSKTTERYEVKEFALPELFWTDLKNVLGLLVTSREMELSALVGHYTADRLQPFITRVRSLAQAQPAGAGETRGRLYVSLADALTSYGLQSGQSKPIEEALTAYGEALKEIKRERAAVDWARIKNNLGNALASLGTRENGTERLSQALEAYAEALQEYSRERVPLDWAGTQNNLGVTLAALGEREDGSLRLEQALTAYRESLTERTRERTPLQWAATQNNLGNALLRLGEREGSVERLEQAVAAYREALKERTRERVPLAWALTMNNLGSALLALGERQPGTARLDEAIATFRDALTERTRERVPLDWAVTQTNLGNAMFAYGLRDPGTAHWESAVAAYRSALSVFVNGEAPLDLGQAHHNLGTALQALATQKSLAPVLCEALEHHLAAWELFSGGAAAYYVSAAAKSIASDLADLERGFDPNQARDCRQRHQAALARFLSAQTGSGWAH